MTEQQILNAQLLVVDDELVNVVLITEILHTAGYTRVESTTDPRDVDDLYRSLSPDLVVLDINMPHMTGFDVLEKVRELEPSRFLPVLMLSGETDRSSRLRALGMGARDFLTKPIDVIEVRMRVRSLVASRLMENQLQDAQQESDRLLLNVLPRQVAEKLKEDGRYTPVRYEDASVMFGDFAGFTQIAEKMSPKELIEELEVCFTYFDRVVQRYDLQRIKTIGDGYMCAGGLPEENGTHPLDCVLAGLDMQNFVNHRRDEMHASGREYWHLRLGIHTGPVIAGVIGAERFAYDLWGDTVNVASRLESSGEPGKVNISRDAYERVSEFFVCESRGEVPAKHKGMIEMFFVHRIRPEMSLDEEGIRPDPQLRHVYRTLEPA